MNFEEKVEQTLQEGFGTSAVMEVSELRRLYYGRLNLFVTFSNDENVEKDATSIDRPLSIEAFSVFDVVGRKVKSNRFYAHVFRINPKNFISNIKTYDTTSLKRDLVKLASYPNVDGERIAEIIENTIVKSMLRSPFLKLWEITKQVALEQNRSMYRMTWRRIFRYLGYEGISDPSGTGILSGRGRAPTTIIFSEIKPIDIVPIQKHRKDERNRVINNVNRTVTKAATARNRIAKRKFKNRQQKNFGSFVDRVIGALSALSI